MPELDRQPPLPKTTPVHFVNQDKVYNDERDLVPISPYIEKQAYLLEEGSSNLGQGSMLSFQDGHSMDLNKLLFIIGQGRGGMPQSFKKLQNAPPGPCYNCWEF